MDSSEIIASLKAEIESLKSRCERAERSEQNFLDALRLSPMALCHHDRALKYTWLYNGHMGFVQEDVLGKTDWDILDKDLADRMGVIKRRVLRTGVGERVEMPTKIDDENCEYFDLAVEPLHNQQGEITGLACSGIDVTEDRRLRERYKTSEENLRFIFNASPLPIMVINLSDGDYMFFNPAADQLFDIQMRQHTGFNSNFFATFKLTAWVQDSLSKGEPIQDHRFEFIKEGALFHLALQAKQIRYHGEPAMLATFIDLTHQVEQHKRLEQARVRAEKLAHTDMMTGLDNRRSLFSKCEKLLEFHNRSTDHICALVIDIDYFKKINDSLGHYAGDQAIKQLGQLLKSTIRHTDIAARYGGEEFALILPETTLEQAELFAEKLRKATQSLDIETDNETINITASFGVAEFNPHMSSVGDLLNAADIALYQAKSAGRNCVKTAEDHPPLTN
ncbi:sensor domain-containing diguanylate cyclase [uncultured Neptuniibacter sp.]|uniref:sensor domain-containing diguanylate cyclase n=1 Tax=uncultured Neptuniibacter sp. TaxID=502143 RepID=UPI0026200172|nr:sensor domain-containing diguanylate cyclase [uncultured Neptuniibacter sp.]